LSDHGKKPLRPLLRLDDLSPEQTNAVDELISRRQSSLWAKPGSGKTVITLTAAVQLYAYPILVVATKRICELVWRQECKRWEHLKDLEVVLVFGTPSQRRAKLAQPADVYLINYELVPWLVVELGRSLGKFGALIFDEISKMKSANTQRFKALRKPILDVPVRFGMTGTPRGNSILGLWGQTYITNGPQFAPTMTRFKARWFFPVDRERRIWRPLPGAEEELREAAKPYAFSVPRATAAPEAKIVPVPVSLPPKIRKLYHKLEEDLEVETDGIEITAVEPGANRGKRLQICGGAVYYGSGKSWHELHRERIDALRDIAEDMQGEPLLVFYRYRHELERIRRDIPGVLQIDEADKWLSSGGTLAVHPVSAAHGLNLHVGGCSTSVWFTMPDSQELWEQGNRRLARRGQTEEVSALVLYTPGTVEEKLAADLASHGRLQDKLIDAAEVQI